MATREPQPRKAVRTVVAASHAGTLTAEDLAFIAAIVPHATIAPAAIAVFRAVAHADHCTRTREGRTK